MQTIGDVVALTSHLTVPTAGRPLAHEHVSSDSLPGFSFTPSVETTPGLEL
jgi:hypothetical protein